MATFPDIVIDPYLVCLPREPQAPEQLDEFVENLLSWSELLQRDEIKTFFLSRVCYPSSRKATTRMGTSFGT